jgi:acetyl esterase/lipase
MMAVLGAAMPADAGRLRDRISERMEQRRATKSAPQPEVGKAEFSYGADPLQRLDFWRAKSVRRAPLLIFVHGGGWKKGDKSNATGQYKPPHFTGLGYAFASINYRLVPAATVEQQAADVAKAVAYLKTNAARLGIDAERIVLMGHSAGAHLVALVGTDERYLRAAGLSFDDLTGVIPLDGAAYDVPQQLVDGNRIMQDTYAQAFGSDPERQRALSPAFQAAAPNAGRFLILHVERDDGARQSAALAQALRKAGTSVQLQGFAGKGLRGHMEINRQLGDPAYPATAVVDGWLKQVFGR